jgi:hypothetical protein
MGAQKCVVKAYMYRFFSCEHAALSQDANKRCILCRLYSLTSFVTVSSICASESPVIDSQPSTFQNVAG